VVVVYAFELLVEIFINFVITSFNFDSFKDLMNTDLYFSTYFIVCMNLLLIYFLNKFRLGFSFIKISTAHPVGIITKKEYLLLFSGLLFIGACSYSLFNAAAQLYITIVLVSFFVMLLLFRFSWRKEVSD
jgi:hypothetical protein